MESLNIPFLDVGAGYRSLQSEIEEAVLRSLRSGWYIGGEDVAAFEREFAGYSGAAEAIGVANGLDALHLTLRAMGVGAGDEVIVPSNTFIATWLAVSQCGAHPVPVEPAPGSFNIDPQRVAAALTPRTKVIVPVHLYGQPADLQPLLALAAERGLRVLSDAAQAHGARYRGQPVGALGDAAAWSFYPAKNLGALGDAGTVTTSDPALARQIRLLRNYGSETKYQHALQGYNSRLDPLHAAALRVKLRHLDAWNERRRAIARHYLEALADLPELQLPAVPAWAEPVWHLFVVRHARRDALAAELQALGVATQIHYPIAPHLQPAYEGHSAAGSLPLSEAIHREVLSLPMDPMMGDAQAARVAAAVRQAVQRLR